MKFHLGIAKSSSSSPLFYVPDLYMLPWHNEDDGKGGWVIDEIPFKKKEKKRWVIDEMSFKKPKIEN